MLYTTDNTPILEATIRKVSRDVVGLDLKAEEISQGRLTISWDILEHNDGGIIQIIYAGSPSVTIQAEGILEVQNEIKHTKSLEKGGEVIYNPVRSSYTGLAYGLVIAGIFGLFIIWMGSAVQRHFNLPTKFPLIEMLFCVVCFGLAFYLIFIVKDPSPPFSF
ncbi:MAG TPA: hypothetical protein VLR90_05425 [Blastocatellia bacterium]|nr:hypothetical protein [Blastocatellia bacterium]